LCAERNKKNGLSLRSSPFRFACGLISGIDHGYEGVIEKSRLNGSCIIVPIVAGKGRQVTGKKPLVCRGNVKMRHGDCDAVLKIE